MFDTKFFDDMAKRLSEALPEGVKNARDDVERNFRSILQSMFGKLDLVTREEFDVQALVLSKTRAKIEKLEKHLEELEKKLIKTKIKS